MAGVADVLRHNGHAFEYGQIAALLQEYHAAETSPSPDRLRFTGSPQTTFPSSAVVTADVGEKLSRVELACMNLFGAASPLPQYVSEHIMRHEQAGGPLRDFVDMFNDRLQRLLYDALTMRRLPPPGHRRSHHAGARALQQLGHPSCLLPRGAGALCDGVSRLFADATVAIQHCAARWQVLAARVPVGAARLGDNALCGSHVWDCAGTFVLRIGPVPGELYRTALPDKPVMDELVHLLNEYVDRALVCEVHVSCEAQQRCQAQPGSAAATLGTTVTLGSPASAPLPTRRYRIDLPAHEARWTTCSRGFLRAAAPTNSRPSM